MLKIWGIKFKLNILFLVVLFLFSISGLLITASLSFMAVLLHELAHSIVAQKEGVVVNEIELLPFGGVAKFRDLIQLKPKIEIKIALAGPIVNFILAALSLLLVRYKFLDLEVGIFFIKINLIIAIFNLIPALPLDGGRVLRALLTIKYGYKEATYYLLQLSKIVAFILAIISLVGLYYGYINMTMLVISFFIYFAALKEGKYTSYVLMQYIAKKKGKILKEKVVQIQQLIAIESTPLKEIIDKLIPNYFHVIMVVDKNLEVLGLVTEDKFINSLINDGIDTEIKDLLI
ncbi:M50 family metallopeptidase [Orenia marismortui]|uniref:Stage IV sporulation protein FB n=1 Tax=Orenia marismortui TaxID=46469 RepID=A0A4R8H2X7_9FIRM|nr:M50 family metallopeptidase [Orenia marismortui]TDX49006.1 stage IV sporulation protein FB [Orenia marismortui]